MLLIVQRATIPLALLIVSSLVIQTIAYGQSLADCKLVASHFRNTCNHGDYDIPALNVTNMTSATVYCDDGSRLCFAGATVNRDGVCEWERKLCVTCREVDGVTRIRLQTNNLPDHCIENKLADQLILDYEVDFNQHETFGELARDLKTRQTLHDEVCPIAKQYDRYHDPLHIVEYGDVESERAMGFSINGIAFQFANSIQQDPLAPITVDNEQPLDICLGHNQMDSLSGMYHYHAISPCINTSFLINKPMSECVDNNECSRDVVSWMLSGYEGMKSKTVIGISKYGHVLYGPYDDSEELWEPREVDACNGVWSDDEDEYFYVSTRWHPYGVGCQGPANFPEHDGIFPNCSTNGIDKYIDGELTPKREGNGRQSRGIDAKAVVAAPDELKEEYLDTPWSLTMTGKDMVILMLVAVNLVNIMAACCLCARSKRFKANKYRVVAVDSDIDVIPEEVALRELRR